MELMYLIIDTESAGLLPGCSLLEVYLGIFDATFSFISELNLFLKPNDSVYTIDPSSLRLLNKDILVHDKIACTYKEAGTIIYNFLKTYKTNSRFIPLGTGVAGDCKLIQNTLITSWGDFVSNVPSDTLYVARFLQSKNLLPWDQKISLQALTEYYNIPFTGQWHTAKSDARASLALYMKLLEIS